MSTHHALNEQWARLLAAGKVRWMPGMVAIRGPSEHPYRFPCAVSAQKVRASLVGQAWTPDFTDPATLGCLLAMARERYPDATTQIDGGRWWVAARDGRRLGAGPTEAGALLAAIEAAP